MPPLQVNKDSSSYQGRTGKSVEEIYQKKTQLEHILLRPDTYVGSVEHQFQEMWIWDPSSQQVVFPPGTCVDAAKARAHRRRCVQLSAT